nr:oxygen-independent coproporphyrinogen III oxidase [Bordetella genomosp. 5]
MTHAHTPLVPLSIAPVTRSAMPPEPQAQRDQNLAQQDRPGLDQAAIPAPAFSPELLARMSKNGPRYTSYPTADRYTPAFGPDDYQAALQVRARTPGQPLSLYIHIPFCESVCYYCACNKIVTRHHDRASRYLAALEREIALHTAVLGEGEPVSQLHFGGGTPTFLSDDELDRLMQVLRARFAFQPDAEISIEVDPRTVSAERLAHLARLGFNRLSLGVQDFDEAVQRAIHRVQPFEQVEALMRSARELGFASINMDLIYGLPLQSAASFARTIALVGALRPDRIALYAYAHLPERFKPQRRILDSDLPDPATRVGLLGSAIAGFLELGYVYIGMDHFALPEDSLARARASGQLQRNFQGYSTQPDCDLVALGVSSIGRVGSVYAQNVKTLDAYYERIEAGRFATERGLQCTPDDLVRRDIIMALMCRGEVDLADHVSHCGGTCGSACRRSDTDRVAEQYPTELARLRELEALELCSLDGSRVRVTPQGWYFVRAIAMTFDRRLRDDAVAGRYSRIA